MHGSHRRSTLKFPDFSLTKSMIYYQYLKLMREKKNQSNLDRRCTVPIFQFINYIKSSFMNEYDPVCNIPNCYT